MNMAMAFMYMSGFWIRKDEGVQLSKLIMVFLQCYTTCARLSQQEGYHRFGLMPKLHYIHHTAHTLRLEGMMDTSWVINPLSTSVQVQEDFIGRPSRVSRRVDARTVHQRVIDRSLICVQQALEESDQDARGLC